MPANVTIRGLGNAGFEWTVETAARTTRVYIDAFFHPMPQVGTGPFIDGDQADPADVILVTHAHPDHGLPHQTVRAARKSGAVVVAPRAMIDRLERQLPPEQLRTLEPPERRRPYAHEDVTVGAVQVRAFRTRHGPGHNSYLVDMDGWRALHDGDNERTQPYDIPALGRVDALFLCPWQGSGADAFVRTLKPERWFLMHLTEAELADHARGVFLPPAFSMPPAAPEAVALAPGAVMRIDS